MSATDHRVDVPLEAVNLGISIERAHHHGGRFQWGRETFKNSEEAGAARVLFGVEWQGFERHGVYRLMIADDGPGMDEDELLAFFRTYGNSGKAIGGLHENFGQGAKSSLLPWNTHGLIVISHHEDYEVPLVMWLRKDPTTGEYGARTWDSAEGGVNVVSAHEVDLGNDMLLDLRDVAPDFVRDAGHGTVLLLLGDDPNQDTIIGDTTKGEHLTLESRSRAAAPGRGLHTYLTKRLWDVGDMKVEVDVFATADRDKWPTSRTRGQAAGVWRPFLGGVWHQIDYKAESAAPRGKLGAQGTVTVSDGTEIDWYLWDGERSGMGRGFEDGFIAARYCPTSEGSIDEMFDLADDGRAAFARYRQFGISDVGVSKRLWLVARPPLAGDDGRYGVYMSTDRAHLHIQGGPNASDPLPWSSWAEEFARSMPDAIKEAIADSRSDDPSDPTDEALRSRLADRFSKRWRMTRLLRRPDGLETGTASSSDGEPRAGAPLPRRRAKTSDRKPSGGRDGDAGLVRPSPTGEPAAPRPVSLGLPQAEFVGVEHARDLFAPGMFAVWNPPSAANPDGLIQLNPLHPVLEEELAHWKVQYPPHVEPEVEKIVTTVYKELAITSVAHSFALTPYLNNVEDTKQLLEPAALTMALLGLMGADGIIGPRLGALGVKKIAGKD